MAGRATHHRVNPPRRQRGSLTLSLALGVAIGAIMGLTGAGGGILAVPTLTFGMHWPIQQAAPVALLAVASAAALGALEGLKRKQVRYRAAILMALAGVPVTLAGQHVAGLLSQRVLLGLFGALMVYVALRVIRSARRMSTAVVDADSGSIMARLDPATGRLHWTPRAVAAVSGIGAVTGFLTGLLGVGGGFVIVPLLKRYTDIPMQGIVPTSLLVIALVGSGGVATALLHGVHMPVALAAAFAAANIVGMILGRLLTRTLSPAHIQMAFGTTLLVVAAGLLGKAALGL
ncbi:MAG: sulfite exporter TauE/SafE family protein [Gammaproteobacteria bacterium]|nr:sulfite exporter TauE/SafE family protein [Gammaproteobacteria bacterium]